MSVVRLFTVGHKEKSAEEFFTELKQAEVSRIIDVRLSNDNHLAGFARALHLPFFLKEVAGIEYVYWPELAPTKKLRDSFILHKGKWQEFALGFQQLMVERGIIEKYADQLRDGDCLLCSCLHPDYCHRNLLAELFSQSREEIEVTHLV